MLLIGEVDTSLFTLLFFAMSNELLDYVYICFRCVCVNLFIQALKWNLVYIRCFLIVLDVCLHFSWNHRIAISGIRHYKNPY